MRRRRPVTVWYLEMTDPARLRPARPVVGFTARRLEQPDPELSRSMYIEVGGAYEWTDRLGWDRERWRTHLERPGIETWIGLLEDEAVGYAELVRQAGEVQLASFGLRPGFTGRGMGGALLAAVTRDAWETGARRVWLHTCSLDSAAALPAYERRGFRRYREATW